ncbi:MAG: imm11 family protein [Paracoccaceae bacterium]
MAYTFGVKPVTSTNIYFEYLNGDRSKVTNTESPIEVGINPPPRLQATRNGHPIDPTHLTTRFRPKSRLRSMPDLIGDAVGIMCSPKVKDIIERLDPGVHAFYAISYEWKNGDVNGDHFIFVPQRTLKALHPELIDPPYTGPMDYWDGMNTRLYPNSRVVFSHSRIGDAHYWADPQLSYQNFLSDTLKDAFEEANVTGFDPRQWIEEL